MRGKWAEFGIGLFVVVAAILILCLVVTMGSRLFSDDYRIVAYFKDVAGLSSGISVRPHSVSKPGLYLR